MDIGKKFGEKKKKALIKIRHEVLRGARCWFNDHDYIEVHGPTLIPALGDWPNYFEVKYFKKKAYLSQGLQPYANAFLEDYERIYTVAPTFRAEKSKTKRHLTEFWRIEVAQRCDLETIMEVQENLLTHICHHLTQKAEEQLNTIGRPIQDLAKVKTPFHKLTYDAAIDLLNEKGADISWGQQLRQKLEKELSHRFDQPFFVKEFPVSIQTLFLEKHHEREEIALSADLFAPEGYGEIGSGGQITVDKKILFKKLSEEEIETKAQSWYAQLLANSLTPHSGFMIGIERLIQWICKLADIRDASLFPRSVDKIYP